jgi:prepilin-type N-terminal cleavage/methylation domain-containing protein
MTLIEMMVAVAIFAVVMGVVFTFLVNSRRSYTDMSQRVEYQQSVRAVMNLVTREIRSAGCDPAGVNFNRIPLADDTMLQCRMDLDGDGAIEVVEPAEDVVYQYLAGPRQVIRNSGFGNQIILRNVDNLTFRYFDENGNELLPVPLSAANTDLLRYVEIDITGTTDRNEQVNYVTRALVRNE